MRAVENAVGVQIPENARLLRNLLHGAQYQHDHIVHFYHLHALDWVDIVSALSADPKKTAALADNVSEAPWGGAAYYKNVQNRIKSFVDSGQLGPFANAYWGHSAYKLPPEANLMAVAHYLEALEWQKDVIKIHAILGSKNPHPQTFLVGGMSIPVDPNSQTAINADKIAYIRKLLRQAMTPSRAARKCGRTHPTDALGPAQAWLAARAGQTELALAQLDAYLERVAAGSEGEGHLKCQYKFHGGQLVVQRLRQVGRADGDLALQLRDLRAPPLATRFELLDRLLQVVGQQHLAVLEQEVAHPLHAPALLDEGEDGVAEAVGQERQPVQLLDAGHDGGHHGVNGL